MANTKTAYRWNADGWYFKTIEVKKGGGGYGNK